jgi:hypothetical protein
MKKIKYSLTLSVLLLISLLASSQWSITGNSGITPTTNFIGTTDSKSLRFRTNNTERMILDSLGKVGIGTSSPGGRLSVHGSSDIPQLVVRANSTQTTNLAEWQDNSGSAVFSIAANGDIGNYIYHTYPVEFNRAKNGIYVRYGVAIAAANAPENTEVGRGMFGRDDGSEVGMYCYNGDIGFYAGSVTTPKFYIKMTTANVGIGTNTPNANAKLDVNGNIFTNGKIAIGTTDTAKMSGYSLAVNGNALFNMVKVKTYGNWPDYVFHTPYKLRSLSEVEKFIQQNNHLPEVPSAEEIEKNGLDLGDNQAMLLKKIEELTLYAIDQNSRMEDMQKQLEVLKKQQITTKN